MTCGCSMLAITLSLPPQRAQPAARCWHLAGQSSTRRSRGSRASSLPSLRGDDPAYRCLSPTAPPPGVAPSCEEAGVLGALPGTLGTLQAAEALKLVLEIGKPLAGRLLVLDALALRFHELVVVADPACAYAETPRVVPATR